MKLIIGQVKKMFYVNPLFGFTLKPITPRYALSSFFEDKVAVASRHRKNIIYKLVFAVEIVNFIDFRHG